MIGLPEDWDEDLFVNDKRPADSTPFHSRPRAAVLRSTASKAAELLARASDAAWHGQGMQPTSNNVRPAVGILPHAELPDTDAAEITVPHSHVGAAGAKVGAFKELDGPTPDAMTLCEQTGYGGVFDDFELPLSSDSVVQTWISQAPHSLSLSSSFRASMHSSLVAQPLVHSGSAGTFRIKLLQMVPDYLGHFPNRGSQNQQGDVRSGISLLETQLKVAFAPPIFTATDMSPMSMPPLTVPHTGIAQELLDKYIEKGSSCLGSHTQEAFELLRAFFGQCPPQEDSRTYTLTEWPPKNRQTVQNVRRNFSAWLACVNARKVAGHIGRQTASAPSSKIVDLSGAKAIEGEDLRLKIVYHHLTANSVQRALHELEMVASRAVHGTFAHFDRLAAVVASCGGASTTGRERRRWLRQQVIEWRSQGVHELMGTSIWRIYSLLAGDFDDVLVDALDWRTAFGMFVWYRFPAGCKELDGSNELLEAVKHFEAAVEQHGITCCFRPVPPYLTGGSKSQLSLEKPCNNHIGLKSYPEAMDLHFNIIRGAVGLVDWRDLSHLDYLTHTSRPMDIASSWHVSVAFLALCGGDTADEGFQLLTQQYCFLLELTGGWEWAIYVAFFIRDSCTRSAIINGLVQRHAVSLDCSELRPALGNVPSAWMWRAQALWCEIGCDWLTAVSCWLQCGCVERAISIAVAFLQGPLLLGHAIAPFQGGVTEAICLAPMTPPAHWLLALYQEHEAAVAMCKEAWAKVCRDALSLLRDWSKAVTEYYEPVSLVQLYWQCSKLRQHLLGVPW
mmetsp:Transcript_79492/g.219880  ORF Transcript_79492/g.219880 Transcript_79492/m.219880 type:complete len:787 (-) Transcript_79492:104-2464(-)